MSLILGIGVITGDKISHLLGIAKAAKSAGKQVQIFLTGEGVHLTQEAHFSELLEVGRVELCRISYITNGYEGKEVPGLSDEEFVGQFRNAEIVEKSDRYIVL